MSNKMTARELFKEWKRKIRAIEKNIEKIITARVMEDKEE